MSIEKAQVSDNEELVIKVSGRFDFSSHQDFRKSYEAAKAKVYIVDLNETTYLDSSALGMLLLLRDHAGGEQSSVRIIGCNEEVRKIFAMSNFDQLFNIE